MKELTFNEWQSHLSKQLETDYRKLKLIKDEKLHKIPRRKSSSIRGVQEVRISANK